MSTSNTLLDDRILLPRASGQRQVSASGNSKSAAFWSASGIIDIGAEMAFTESIAYDINDHGVVALQGNHPGPFGVTAGYVWNQTFGGTQVGAASQIYDLNHLLRRKSRFRILVRATGVNESGDVVGFGELFNADVCPFVIPQLGNGPSSGLFGHPGEPARLR